MNNSQEEQSKEIEKSQSQKSSRSFSETEVEELLIEQEQRFEQTLELQMTEVRSGPIPSPEEIKHYKLIEKSYPDRIMKMAESEQKFRHRSTYIGQFGLPISFIIAGIAGIFSPPVGVVIAIGTAYGYYATRISNPKPPQIKQQK